MRYLKPSEWPDWLKQHEAESRRLLGISAYLAAAVPPDSAGESSETLYGVLRNLYNARLVKMDPGSIIEQWCYHTDGEALAQLLLWDGMPPGPEGWIRNISMRGIYRRNEETGEVTRD